MPKTENTAVNRLIEQAHERPLDADDALFSSPPPRKSLPRPFPNRIDEPAPLPRHRIPSSTQTQLAAAPPVTKREADLEDSGLLQVDDDDDDMPMTVGEPAVRIADIKPIAARPSALGAVPSIDESNWYEESVGVDRVDEAQLGTRFVRRSSKTKSLLLLCGAFVTGLVATAFIAWPSRSPSVTPETPAPVVAPKEQAAPAVAPAVVEPVAPAEPAVVEPTVVEPAVVEPAVVEPTVVEPVAPAKLAVELASEPSGATVLLVDGATTVTLGSTPLSHELEPSKSYELMFTLAGHKSALVTVDPTKSQRVSVDLASSTATAAPRAEEATTAEPRKVAKAEPRKVAKAEPRKVEPRKAAPRVADAGPAKGGGLLAIGAKPPCDIFIDGKPTRLKTPQREIKLSPGPHKITLVNREHKITETFTVDVKAGAPTKVVKDLTKRMK